MIKYRSSLLIKIILCIILAGPLSGQNSFKNIKSLKALDSKVSLNFKDYPLVDILRLFALQHSLNIVNTDEIEGNISVSLQDVNLGTALDAILKVNGFDWFIMENIIVVKPADFEIEGQLVTRVYKLKYVDATAIAGALQNVLTSKGLIQVFSPVIKGGLLGGRGGAGQTGGAQGSGAGGGGLAGLLGGGGGGQQQTGGQQQAGGGQGGQGGQGGRGQSVQGMDHILVTDTFSNFPKIEEIIKKLDQQIAQVNIAVKFIETKLATNERLGIDWSGRSTLNLPAGSGGENTDVLHIGNWKSMSIATLSLPVFTAILDILSGDASTRLLQEPQITVKDNVLAFLTVGTSIPILVPQSEGGLAGTPQMTFENEEINITLSVLTRINEDKYISMDVTAEVQALVGYTAVGERPIISTRSTQTSVMVKNGETLLMGGLIFDQLIETSTIFPVLGKIPFIRKFFTHKSTQTEQRELLLFITPNIIKLS